jgi:DNA-directed RNA polymerase subunit RPC12/RpoP
MAMIPIACATCGALSQIDEAWLGQWVECPHCGKATLAAARPTAPPAAPKVAPPPPAEPPRPLTREERQAIRRRRHLIVAIGSIVVLMATVFGLLALRG